MSGQQPPPAPERKTAVPTDRTLARWLVVKDSIPRVCALHTKESIK